MMVHCWTARNVEFQRDLGMGLAMVQIDLEVDLAAVAVGDLVRFETGYFQGKCYVIKNMDLEKNPPWFELDTYRIAISPPLEVLYEDHKISR